MPHSKELHIFINISIIVSGILAFALFFSKKVRTSTLWLPTVTPLASIIGSGFLIVAPLLWLLVGYHAIWVIAGILLVAYAIGSIIRFNIQYTEPYLTPKKRTKTLRWLENASHLTLSFSYIISIAFYIRLMCAFILKLFFIENGLLANGLSTVMLAFIGLIGYLKGFNWLEILTEYSVNIKMSIIVMLITGLFLHDWLILGFQFPDTSHSPEFNLHALRQIFGTLLIVQGFEISRYIGNKYSAQKRITSMRLAQIISSVIYILFIFLVMFIMTGAERVSETEIMDISEHVSSLLPIAVAVGAIFSQFSAAVADTVGGGGTFVAYSTRKISPNLAYLCISGVTIIIIWIFNVFEIISIASRTFAAYYFTQCLQSLYINHKFAIRGWPWTIFASLCSFFMFVVLIFGIPVEG